MGKNRQTVPKVSEAPSRRRLRGVDGIIYLCVGVCVGAALYACYLNVTREFETKNSNHQTVKNDSVSHREQMHAVNDGELVIQHTRNAPADNQWGFQPMMSGNDSLGIGNGSVSLSHSNQTVNLDFQPLCNLTTEKVMSVLERLTTVQCKSDVTTLACLDLVGQLYPKRLPYSCPAKAPAAGEYLGCYSDSLKTRVLDQHYVEILDNTPLRCIDVCFQLGFPFSGVEYRRECFCGYKSPNSTLKLSFTACNMTCAGDASQTCGGFFAVSVYHTGVPKLTSRKIVEINYNVRVSSGPRVKVLYLLTFGSRNVRQVKRLFKALYHSTETYFIIHVDSRQDYMFRELLPLEERFPNVRLSRYRRPTIWGAASLLDVILHCMEEVLSLVDWHWDYLINLSESDFPIKTHETFITFLTANNGTNFISHHPGLIKGLIEKQGLHRTFYECENRMWNLGERKFPFGIQIDAGSDWILLTRSFVQYAVHSVSELVVGLKSVSKYTLLPAEMLIVNSEFCETSANQNVRYINFKRQGPECGCSHVNVVDWCGCSPLSFRLEDWNGFQVAKRRNIFFARKFSPIINQAIINNLETWLYDVQPGIPGWTSYWENEFDADVASPPAESAFYTVYASLSRLSVKMLNSLTSDKCKLATINRVLEATLYKDEDIFKGTLILFNAILSAASDEKVVLETRFMPKHFYEIINPIEPVKRLKSMEVGSNYHEVEKVFLNLGRLFGPRSILGLEHKWSAGQPLNATFVWVDPTNTVADVKMEKIPAGIYTSYHQLKVNQPLRPGIWTVKLLHLWKPIAETKFLVVPLSHNGTSPISPQDAVSVNGGLPGRIHYSNIDLTFLEKRIGLYNQKNFESQLLKAQQNGKLLGPKLLDWIDGLVSKFYNIQGMCYVKMSLSPGPQSCILDVVTPCRLISWSSRSMDPKSSFGKVNKFTGLLER